MLKRLRFQLTVLYILAALGLVVLTGVGSYSLVSYYFQKETDLALEYKMATEFRSYGLIPPLELVLAERSFTGGTPRASQTNVLDLTTATLPAIALAPSSTIPPTETLSPTSTSLPTATLPSTPISTRTPAPAVIQPKPPTAAPKGNEGEKENEGEGGGGEAESPGSQPYISQPAPTQPITTQGSNPTLTSAEEHEMGDSSGYYDEELSSIYVLPINASGQVIATPSQSPAPFTRNDQASKAALVNGYDWRTVTNPDGTRVRLLTYRLSNPDGPAILQLGRTLTYQDRVLRQFLMGLLVLGAITSVLLGIGSWWLSGRSLSPAQKAWDQQQAFVSNASHELRTPLTLIRANAEVGLRQQPDQEQQDYLKGILDETDYMNRLVDDLLLLSRLDAHRLKLAHEEISLVELLEETSRQAEKLGLEKGIHVEVGQAQGAIWGDRTRMRQVLLILLDNALRFTPQGGTVRMEASERRESNDRSTHRGMRQLVVSDNGSGISAEHLPHVFERFYQASAPGDPQVRTNGLGLSIARGLIEAQGGEISIASQVGRGTRVTLELPAVEPSR